MRVPAGAHVPARGGRGPGVGQERARGHAPPGPRLPDPRAQPVEEVRLVPRRGRGGTPNLPGRDFRASRPFEKLGTDVTEFKVAGGKAYLAPVYDMCTKMIVAWDVSRHPDKAQQRRLLDALRDGARPILHTDMGWQYQHAEWIARTEAMGVRRSTGRKGNCLDNAASEQVSGRLKDEFYRGRSFDSFDQFKRELDAYITHWNTMRRQEAIGGMTPVEYRGHMLSA